MATATLTTDLTALAARCSTLAGSLLTAPQTPREEGRYLAQSLLKLAGELVECSFMVDPYLWHVDRQYWEKAHHWYMRLTSGDLSAEQETAILAIAKTWAALLDAEEVQS